jgi:hypothetical protein
MLALPQLEEPGTSGVSENQNVPDAGTSKRDARYRMALNSPAFMPSSRPTPTRSNSVSAASRSWSCVKSASWSPTVSAF